MTGPINAEMLIRVTDLAPGGSGVARDSTGRVIFVPFSAPGDHLRVRVTFETKRFAEAEILEVLEPSSHRQKARCAVFGVCGGCQWQHLDYNLQWQTKVAGVLESLKRMSISVESPEEIRAEKIWEYRNRIQLHGHSGKTGFFKRQSRDLVSVKRCEIAMPELNQALKETEELGSAQERPYKVELEVRPDHSISRTWDAPHSATGFRQVHNEQNQKLRQWIYDQLEDGPLLYDLFGGAGNLSLPLLDKIKEVHCVDLSSPSNGSSEKKTSRQVFHRTSVVDFLKRAKNTRSRSSKVQAILDPPRKGLSSDFSLIAQGIEGLGVTQMVMVGCEPNAWARDLSGWLKRGWTLKKVMLMDLFPQTTHIESVALIIL